NGLTYSTAGVPTYSEFSKTLTVAPNATVLPALPANFLNQIITTLPEGKDIRSNSKVQIPDSDEKSNIILSQSADVWVSFVYQNAGFTNSTGYFVYDPDNPPTSVASISEKIIFPNVKATASATTQANTVYLGKFDATPSKRIGIGFVIMGNGWHGSSARVNPANSTQRIAGVKDYQNRRYIFYSIRALNPEIPSPANLNGHTIMLKDLSTVGTTYQRIVLGFEDYNREDGGDSDFNDVVLAVHLTPNTSIANLSSIQSLWSTADIDTDGDGVMDSNDEFPNDASLAFSRYYPDQNTFGTLAYEDAWPVHGDYDLNDMVVNYKMRELLSPTRAVGGVQMSLKLNAAGAVRNSGFAIRLPGVLAQRIQSASLSRNNALAQPTVVEAGQTDASFIIFNNALQEMQVGPNCSFVNTENLEACKTVSSSSYFLDLRFKSSIVSSAWPLPPYDPYIFRTTVRGQEVHLPGKQPTALADLSLFKTGNDNSIAGTSTTYVDNKNLPWALDIPIDWSHPQEKVDITQSHPQISTWVQSAGKTNKDWYKYPDAQKIYIKR
ncbi:LruC domain-containing protein, partial [Undibacterium sp.]|uniref:LruC domain-containing protein n=1 Tax=Undibacterium sp. TaxID=1914977 RepID=UPI0037520E34